MTNMRRGFTMIELIFVIIGILAAVAIPKLAATRDDAKIAKGAREASQLVRDLGAYYTANGAFSGTLSDMTNVQADGNNVTAGITYQINDVNCVEYNATTDGNLSVVLTASVSDVVCKGVQSVLSTNEVNKTHHFGGR